MSATWRWLLLLAASSALIKSLAALLSTSLVFDEYLYCIQAFALAYHGELPTIFPLTPMLMAVPLLIAGPSKATFLSLNVVVGGLLVIPTYQLARRWLNAEASLAVAAVTAFSPMMIWSSAHALTEPLFIFLAIYFILLSLSDRKYVAAASGVLGGLAYLCRYPTLILLVAMAAYHVLSYRRIHALLLATSFLAVAASWQLLSYILTGGIFQTEMYSIVKTLGAPMGLYLEALPFMALKVSIGLFIVFTPLIPFIPFLEVERLRKEGFLFMIIAAWLLVHLGYYVYQSLNTYAVKGTVIAAERVARWSLPITPFLATALMKEVRGRLLLIATLISIALSTTLGLYLVSYTNHHAALQLTWSDFLAELGAGA